MDFTSRIKEFSSRIGTLIESIQNEESTKMSLVIPVFQLLGYDIFNPAEFCPEYTADVGIKKGEKVDYAIIIDNQPTILIECKSCTENLEKHSSQLFRYFGTSQAKFGILTNGKTYQFYTDLDEPNKMDLTPFLEIDMLNLKDSHINEFKKFAKDKFDATDIFGTASELKYSSLIKEVFESELDDPSDGFVRFVLSNVYDSPKTQKAIDKFRPVVKRSLSSFINEMVTAKISSALTANEVVEEVATTEIVESKIVTTEEELQAFYIIRGMLAGIIDVNEITYRDTESYFGILYQDNKFKPLCRINLDTRKKQIMIPDEQKKYIRYYIETLSDLYQYKDKLIEVVERYK